MNTLSTINALIVSLGIPTIIGACIYIGRKLQKLDDVVKDVGQIEINISKISNRCFRLETAAVELQGSNCLQKPYNIHRNRLKTLAFYY